MRVVAVSIAAVVVAACAQEPEGPPAEGPDAGAEPAALDRCLAGGGALGQLAALGNLHGAVTAIALSSQGRLLLASEDGTLKLWTMGEEGAELPATYDVAFADGEPVARAVAYAADGTWMAAGRDSGAVERWGLDGVRASGMSTGSDAVTAVAVSADGARVAAADASFGGNLRLWTPSGQVSETLPTTLWAIGAVTFLADGRLVTAGHWYGVPSVEVRDSAAPGTVTATWVGNLEEEGTGAAGAVAAVAPSADERRLAVAGVGFVAVLDLDALAADPPAVLAMAPGHDAIAVAWSPDERFLFTLGREGTLQVWNAADATQVASLEVSGAGLVVDPATGRLVTAGADGYIRLFECGE